MDTIGRERQKYVQFSAIRILQNKTYEAKNILPVFRQHECRPLQSSKSKIHEISRSSFKLLKAVHGKDGYLFPVMGRKDMFEYYESISLMSNKLNHRRTSMLNIDTVLLLNL